MAHGLPSTPRCPRSGPSTSAVTLSVQKAALRTLVHSLAEPLKGSPVRVGAVTVGTGVQPGEVTATIAELFWKLHIGEAKGRLPGLWRAFRPAGDHVIHASSAALTGRRHARKCADRHPVVARVPVLSDLWP